MSKKKVFLALSVIVITSILSGSLGAISVMAWPYSDVHAGDWFYSYVQWADLHGVVTGYPDGTFQPYNAVSRAEAVTMLKAEAAYLVSAGVYVQNNSGTLSVGDWFNNVNGVQPQIEDNGTFFDIDMGFMVSDRFVNCNVDASATATRDAFCNISTPGGDYVRIRIYDISDGGPAYASFWIIVYGQ